MLGLAELAAVSTWYCQPSVRMLTDVLDSLLPSVKPVSCVNDVAPETIAAFRMVSVAL
jgi:hypothetical protein